MLRGQTYSWDGLDRSGGRSLDFCTHELDCDRPLEAVYIYYTYFYVILI
jgi:hypothetical protein